ncbi:Bromodomain domain-containing protein [Cephalotus follicularis]|uniref:Bromodomain domain-containing protein n=1 Tax=Cephalotus follicularis TaxID=3775 RepID=A0A1Q3D6I1_CEPFO|nr:Bromodomain domain-containing protein [Cephalotus follicularis]
MGEVAERMKKKKKKKGRPSLLDLQKRSLKQQQQEQQQQLPNTNFFKNPNSLFLSPNHGRRSTRRNSNPELETNGYDDDDDEDEREQKKHKLLLGLNNSRNDHYLQDSPGPNSASYSDNPEAALKRRKISAAHHGSNQMEEKVLKATDTLNGLLVESGPTTTLPDKKLLVFILERLQKKDTYGVFSEPVDPEELPDYFDIVELPMDFGTVRKKLDGGAYANLEQFEKDILLICSNAMQYNAPDTIYFRQARSMLELAKKDFENLRQESDDSEPPKVVRRGRPPGKTVKKTSEIPFDVVGSDLSSGTTLATGGDNSSWSNAYNLRKVTTSQKFRATDSFAKASNGPQNSEVYGNLSTDLENEFPASVVKAVSKYGKKQIAVDENRRDTYRLSLASGQESSVLTTREGEVKQLIEVGLNSDHGYARSLSQFAAGLGPAIWKIASRKIRSVLPIGLDFGPGWVGESNAVVRQNIIFSGKQKSSNNSVLDDHLSRLLFPTSSCSNTEVANICSLRRREEDTVEPNKGLNYQSELTCLNNRFGGIHCGPSPQVHPEPLSHLDINGFSAGFGFNSPHQMGMARLAPPPGNSALDNAPMHSQVLGMVSSSNPTICSRPIVSENFSRLHSENPSAIGPGSESLRALHVGLAGNSSWQGLSPYNKQDSHVPPPDLNVRFLSPGSPSSSLQIGSPQQPDLALQL